MKNLEGKIVQFHIASEDIGKNNQSKSCPAIVLCDFNHGGEIKDKALNLMVLYDGEERSWETSVIHGNESNTHRVWNLYEE